MKNKLTAAIILTALLALSACGNNSPAQTAAAQTTAAAETTAAQAANDTAANTGADSGSSNTGKTAEAMIPGRLYQLNLKDGEKPVIKGVTLDGGSAGAYRNSDDPSDWINGRPLSDKDIRCIFETQEWISIIIDSDKTAGLSAYIIEHRDDPADYVDSFIAALSDNVPKTDLIKPDDPDDVWGYWGEMYMSSDDWKAGDYDLVFTDGLKPVARVLLKIYNDTELSGKSDDELNSIMKGLNTAG